MKIKKISNILTFIVVILLVVLVICVIGIYKEITASSQKETKILEHMEIYNYVITENDTKVFKDEYNNLKDILSNDEIDYLEYAKSITKLFIIDFYSLSSAINKNDIGGTQFIYSDYKDTFIKKAKDTIYSHVENNIYGKREQELPSVKDVVINNIDKTDFNDFDECYLVSAYISYEEEMGYPEKIEVIVVKNNDKLEIVSIK